MLEGWFVNNVLMHKEIRPYPQQPQETSGVVHGSGAVYRYSLKDSEYPTLIIIDAISDGRGDIIPPGHYELALSDSMDFLIIMHLHNTELPIPYVDQLIHYQIILYHQFCFLTYSKKLMKNHDKHLHATKCLDQNL